jgi:hypothetical protein
MSQRSLYVYRRAIANPLEQDGKKDDRPEAQSRCVSAQLRGGGVDCARTTAWQANLGRSSGLKPPVLEVDGANPSFSRCRPHISDSAAHGAKLDWLRRRRPSREAFCHDVRSEWPAERIGQVSDVLHLFGTTATGSYQYRTN